MAYSMDEETLVIDLGNGLITIIDISDWPLVSPYKWTARQSKPGAPFYAKATAVINGKKTTISMHRLILGLKPGDPRIGDHRFGRTLDNRRSELRIATRGQNSWNSKKPVTNSTGLKGVAQEGKMFRAVICKDKKQIHLGMFNTKKKAHRAYCDASAELHGEFGRTA